MKILVTGANGYLGQGIIKQLLDSGHSVIATDFNLDYVDDRAEKVVCDIFSLDNPYEYFREPDVMLHLAWRDGFKHNSPAHFEDLPKHYSFIEKMVLGGLKQVCVMGTMHEVGFFEGEIDENTPCNPMNMYGIAKNALRNAVELLCKNNNVVFQWLRGYYIVGNSKFGNSIFSKITTAVEEGKKEFPFTTGKNKYDFLDYDDFAKQTSATCTQSNVNGIINICSGNPVSLAERVEKFIADNNYDIKLQYGAFPDREYDSSAIWGSNKKISRILKKSVIVTGANGQLGYDVVKELVKRDYSVIATDITDDYKGYNSPLVCYKKIDITKECETEELIASSKPYAVIHCAAWTAVDLAEDEQNKDKVFAINVTGTKNIALACKKENCKMVYLSTDYVFSGEGDTPWQPDSNDFQPLNFYGETKLKGETAVKEILDKYFVVRTAWVFGLNGKNFINTMLNTAKTHDTLKVVNDQIGTPTYTYDLAKLLVDMINTDKYGFYHATNEGGYISWYDFAVEIFKQAGCTTKVTPVTTAEYGLSKAKRPSNSRLDKSKLALNGFTPLPDWKDAVARYLSEKG